MSKELGDNNRKEQIAILRGKNLPSDLMDVLELNMGVGKEPGKSRDIKRVRTRLDDDAARELSVTINSLMSSNDKSSVAAYGIAATHLLWALGDISFEQRQAYVRQVYEVNQEIEDSVVEKFADIRESVERLMPRTR